MVMQSKIRRGSYSQRRGHGHVVKDKERVLQSEKRTWSYSQR